MRLYEILDRIDENRTDDFIDEISAWLAENSDDPSAPFLIKSLTAGSQSDDNRARVRQLLSKTPGVRSFIGYLQACPDDEEMLDIVQNYCSRADGLSHPYAPLLVAMLFRERNNHSVFELVENCLGQHLHSLESLRPLLDMAVESGYAIKSERYLLGAMHNEKVRGVLKAWLTVAPFPVAIRIGKSFVKAHLGDREAMLVLHALLSGRALKKPSIWIRRAAARALELSARPDYKRPDDLPKGASDAAQLIDLLVGEFLSSYGETKQSLRLFDRFPTITPTVLIAGRKWIPKIMLTEALKEGPKKTSASQIKWILRLIPGKDTLNFATEWLRLHKKEHDPSLLGLLISAGAKDPDIISRIDAFISSDRKDEGDDLPILLATAVRNGLDQFYPSLKQWAADHPEPSLGLRWAYTEILKHERHDRALAYGKDRLRVIQRMLPFDRRYQAAWEGNFHAHLLLYEPSQQVILHAQEWLQSHSRMASRRLRNHVTARINQALQQ